MIAIVIAAIAVVGGATIYFACRSRDFRKFLAGAFFVIRGILHFCFFAIAFYTGFVRRNR